MIDVQKLQVAQLWQRDRAAVVSAVCCTYARKVHCAVVGSCYTGWPCTEHVCLRREVGVFRRGLVTFGKYLTGKGASPTNQCWRQKTRVIAVSCGIKISAVHHLVLPQYTHLTDRQTDGRTKLRQQYRALHYMHPHGKNMITNVYYSLTVTAKKLDW